MTTLWFMTLKKDDENVASRYQRGPENYLPYLDTYRGVLKYLYFKNISKCKAQSSPFCSLQRQCRGGICTDSR